jgi:hypothetical protein
MGLGYAERAESDRCFREDLGDGGIARLHRSVLPTVSDAFLLMAGDQTQ